MKVSVCLATYNGQKYIKEQLVSIVSQLSADDEVIVSDDGSTDDTLAIIAGFDDKRIRVVHNQSEHGYTPNFENALKHASGDIVVLSDQDDVWMPNKLSIIKKDLAQADMVVSDAEVVDGNLNVISESLWSLSSPYHTFWGNIFRFSYLGCCMAFRRPVLEVALPFPSRHLMATHDNWLFLVGKSCFKVCFEKEPLIKYRRHKQNTSTGCWEHAPKSVPFMLKYRAYLMWHILLRKIRCKSCCRSRADSVM